VKEYIMSIENFIIAVGFPVVFSLAAIGYLRPILRNVLTEICGTEERGEFWIRCATLLSLFGALILVLAFGPRDGNADVIESMRWTLVLTLAGSFIGISWIARTIWNSLTKCPDTRARLFAVENEATPVPAAEANP
jgi:hypothetical protein